ncbi:MAG: hypothetical protein LQ344_000639 [Seirophora lacunosa]|nr:MAG: hypothetical protein LQ344_000639 [Seirophora lacunosa]
MSPASFSRNPVITVVHFDVAHNRSVSIEQFLRSLKRDPHYFSSAREGQKRRRLNQSERRLQPPLSLSETTLPALDDDNSTEDLAPQSEERESSERHGHRTGDENIGSRKNAQLPWAANQCSRVKRVYRGKQKNITLAIPVSNETLPPLHKDGERDFLGVSPADRPISDPAPPSPPRPCSPIGHPPHQTEISHNASRVKEATRQTKTSRIRASAKELPLISPLKGSSSPESEVDLDLSKRPVEPAHDPIESCAELGAALRPTNGQSNAKRLSAAKPLGSNQKSYYPSKDDRIHPKDFKPLPQTPAKAKLTSWKLGSGFKNREKPNVGKKKNSLPVREEIRKPDPTQRRPPSQLADNDIEDRAGEVQAPSNTEPQETGQCIPRLSPSNEDDRPTICFTVPKELDPELTETRQDSQRVGKCRSVPTAGLLTSEQTSHKGDIMPFATPTSKPQRKMRQLRGRRKSRQNPLRHPAGTMRNGSSIIPPETSSGPSDPPAVSPGKQSIRSDAHQWFTSRAAPLQRGTSFVLRPRVEAKGNLDGDKIIKIRHEPKGFHLRSIHSDHISRRFSLLTGPSLDHEVRIFKTIIAKEV